MKIHTISQDAFNALNDPRLNLKSSDDVPRVLQYLVEKIAYIMKADVCSLYLYDPSNSALTLKAAHGLIPDKIDPMHLKYWEGLCNMTIKLMKPISVSDVKTSHILKLAPSLSEAKLNSFLSIPLVYNLQPIGCLVIQNIKLTPYRKKDIQLLLSLAIPAVAVVERARFLGAIGTFSQTKETGEVTVEYLHDHHIKGIGAAAGIGMGRLKKVAHRKAQRRHSSTKQGTVAEIQRLKEAFAAVTEEISRTKAYAEKKFGPDEVSIFEAYLLFLESQSFRSQIITEIEKGASAVNALQAVVKKYMDRITQAGDEYIRERAYDIQDIARKISDQLLYGQSDDESRYTVTEDTIFFSTTWSVSDFIHIDTQHTKGIISPTGGASSHISLFADSLGFPAVLGVGAAALQFREGDFVIIDGALGTIIVNPSDETIALYRQQIQTLEKLSKAYLKDRKDHVIMFRPGQEDVIPVGANIEMAGHAANALKAGADEIGLFRTEFPFLVRKNLPTEDEQCQLYRHVLHVMKKRPVTFRTLDIGGDKYISYLELPKETNPSLGWRSIRFSLERKDLFRIQLRALFKASIYGKMRLLFPMVSTMEQILEIEDILESIKKEIADEGGRVATKIPIGYMIEIPAAVEIADKIARHADFLSIGTNDLVQYTLAVDRTNPKVANLYDPYHPAVLKLLKKTFDAAAYAGKSVTVCGDMAANPLLLPVLAALGASGVSMNPSSIPKIKTLLRRFDYADVKTLTENVMKLDTGHEIKAALTRHFHLRGWEGFLAKEMGEEGKG